MFVVKTLFPYSNMFPCNFALANGQTKPCTQSEIETALSIRILLSQFR